jgi:hypothetical protein
VAWSDDGGPAWSRYEVVPTIRLQRVVVSGGISGSKGSSRLSQKDTETTHLSSQAPTLSHLPPVPTHPYSGPDALCQEGRFRGRRGLSDNMHVDETKLKAGKVERWMLKLNLKCPRLVYLDRAPLVILLPSRYNAPRERDRRSWTSYLRRGHL